MYRRLRGRHLALVIVALAMVGAVLLGTLAHSMISGQVSSFIASVRSGGGTNNNDVARTIGTTASDGKTTPPTGGTSDGLAVQGNEGVYGNVTFGNLMPLCRVGDKIEFQPSQAFDLVVYFANGTKIHVPIHWNQYLNCTTAQGSFRVVLKPGNYTLNPSACEQSQRILGCSYPSLPVKIIVYPGRFTDVNIHLTTGIY